MRYTFSKMSVLGALIFITGFLFLIQGIRIRYNLTNIKESYEKSEIKSGSYMECDMEKEQLIGKYYSEGNGTIKYGPYCVSDVWSSEETYVAAINEDLDYYVPLIVSREYQGDFKKMVNSDAVCHIFGKFEKRNTTLHYDTIAKCTGIHDKSKMNQMISASYRIKLVDLEDERRVLYKAFSLLIAGLFILFMTVEREKAADNY